MIPAIDQRETLIDLSNRNLFGWQRTVSSCLVDLYVSKISRGDKCPPVTVFESRGDFSLAGWSIEEDAPDRWDGGHHRAVSHLIALEPLRAIVIPVPSYTDLGSPNNIINIRDIRRV